LFVVQLGEVWSATPDVVEEPRCVCWEFGGVWVVQTRGSCSPALAREGLLVTGSGASLLHPPRSGQAHDGAVEKSSGVR
jgi:hypothetical protein